MHGRFRIYLGKLIHWHYRSAELAFGKRLSFWLRSPPVFHLQKAPVKRPELFADLRLFVPARVWRQTFLRRKPAGLLAAGNISNLPQSLRPHRPFQFWVSAGLPHARS